MAQIIFTASLVAFFSVSAVNCAVSQTAIECNTKHDSCNRSCNEKYDDLGKRFDCRADCTGIIIECLRAAAVNHEFVAKELIQKAKEERKKITCTPAQGNEQRCIQHGQDLMPAVNFKGGGAIECNKQYDTCTNDCYKKDSPDQRDLCRAGCEGGAVGCLRGAAVSAEYVARELKQKAIDERKKITCTPAQGNVQRCVQHGQDLK